MADYFTLLTNAGAAALANAAATETPLVLAELAVGDGGGEAVAPVETQTALVNETWRGAVGQVYVDGDNLNWIVVEAVVPQTVGGWYVREIGLFDAAANLVAVAKYPETYKAALAEGTASDLLIRMVLQVSNTGDVTILVDPTQVMATQQYVSNRIAQHVADADPHPAYVVPSATTEQQGKVELATVAEARAGVDTERAVTPAGLAAAVSRLALLRKQLLLNSLLDAMHEGTALRVLDAVADPFADTGKIDAGASSGYVHDAAGAYIEAGSNGYTSDLCMSGTASASKSYSSNVPANAVDNDSNTYWGLDLASNSTEWWQYDFGAGSAQIVRRLRIQTKQYPGPASALKNFSLRASNDATSWTALLTATAPDVADFTWLEWDFINDNSYRYYRIEMTDSYHSQGDRAFREVEMMGYIPPGDMNLVSVSHEASVEPHVGYLLGIIEPIDAVTYGTDVMADMTRDNGATWEAVALSKVGVTEQGHDVVFGEVAFAAGGGRTVRSRWRTANTRHIKLHGSIPDAEA